MTDDPRQLDSDGLRALARALVGDAHDADDLVQDAWVTALNRPPKRGWSLGGWLSGITLNHARQQAREQQRRSRREHASAMPEVLPPADAVERIDRLRRGIELLRQRMDDATDGGRRAWLVPLVPFVSVSEGDPIATLADGAARLFQTSGQGVVAMGMKKSVLAMAIVLGAGLLTVTLWLEPAWP